MKTDIEVEWLPFASHPESDSCWSLSRGPDGRVYAAACCEHKPGGFVRVVRYDDRNRAIEDLFDMDRVVDDPRDSGRATQCKIHYSFAPSRHDGLLYMATHLSGPPIDMPAYSPWKFWHDAKHCFRGSALVAFDTHTDRVLWWDTLFPKEGCRCLLHDEAHGRLYALSYPRDHLFVYDLQTRRSRDLGRIGSVNAQVLFLDARGRVWTSSDYGRLVRYDPERDRLEVGPHVLPHDPAFQTGWHSVLYDAAAAPDGESVFAVTWIAAPRLVRIRPGVGEWGSVEDLGPLTQPRDTSVPLGTFKDHAGGLVFDARGALYYVASRWRDSARQPPEGAECGEEMEGVVWRLNTETLERQPVTLLRRPDALAQYVSRGALDRNGDLFFGHVGRSPVGMFRVRLPEAHSAGGAAPLRMWG
ncbi:MAG: hypothetical protein GXP31_13205 [Kiritimatiellaeota bacterium]|nr:hypothetical protein [Kiritimatiellota bacterium]